MGKETREMEFIFNAKLNVQQMNSALQSFQNNLKMLKLPNQLSNSITKEMDKLTGYLKDFEILTSKTSFNNSDIKEVVNLYNKIGKTIKEIGFDQGKLQGLDIEKLLPKEAQERFEKLGKILTDVQTLLDFKTNAPEVLKELESQAEETSKKIQDLGEELKGLQNKKFGIDTRLANNAASQESIKRQISDLNKRRSGLLKNEEDLPKNYQAVIEKISDLNKKAQQAQNSIKSLNKQIEEKEAKGQSTTSKQKDLANKQLDLEDINKQIEQAEQLKKQLEEQQRTPVKESDEYKNIEKEIDSLQKKLEKLKITKDEIDKEKTANTKDIKAKTAEYEKQEQVLKEINEQQEQIRASEADTTKIQELRQALADIQGIDISEVPEDLEEIKKVAVQLSNQDFEKVQEALKNAGVDVGKLREEHEKLKPTVEQGTKANEEFTDSLKETDALKSRIQYFFGLNNAIQLVKRTMRSAFQTIQELDKAMTATAVVTDFTVGDMWSQLPDYTKRANELGVTTQAAYEAATLYYQQGLSTNEVMAMSNETLKMARIAGLEAADATDRMTNAIRGFNMEINATNAQRIDDVYSKLAAISASNVDEISTAMTKVASLAHSANMEFETTAAFLAQIIETTRESAETAGTALKTVIARFSEVKKLYSMDELRGTDEEGQTIDVNKISTALRTAGIDLNRYFVGEVGLDDIFMELASKWDSLSSVQQRYIATQAAGSRQQSRFIALMQDYARTQELVGAAYNANGASAKQFAKTQDSLESKLARLKNAWNEFAMGILNSDVTKFFVDALTNILNGINAITSGFGTLNQGIGGVIGSLLKLTTLLGGLKLGKGIINGAIGSSLSAVTSGEKGGSFKEIFKSSMASGIGKNLWSSAQEIGIKGIGKGGLGSLLPRGIDKLATGLGAAPELAAGIAGLGSVVAALAAFAVAAQAVYQLWIKYTPEGQLKKAQKEAEKLRKTSEEAEQNLKSINSLQETYKEQTENVNNATTLEDRKNAVAARNEAILEAIKTNGTLAQYVVTEQIDDQIVLTLDEEKLAAAAEAAATAAAQAAIDAYFGTANEGLAQYNVDKAWIQRQLQNILRNQYQYGTDFDEASFNEKLQELLSSSIDEQLQYIIDADTSDKVKGEAAERAARMSSSLGTTQANAMLAYGEKLKLQGAETDLANALVPILGKLYDKTGELTADKLENILDIGQEELMPILDALSGKGAISEESLFGKTQEELEDFTNRLGFTDETLKKFAAQLDNVNEEDLRKILVIKAQELQKIQKANIEKIYKNLFSLGIFDIKDIEKLSPEYQTQLVDITTRAQELITPEEFQRLNIESLISSPDKIEEIQTLLNSINLDNPIQAFLKLQQAEKGASDEVKAYIEAIRASNSEALSMTGRIQSFILSSDYDDLTESLQEFIDTNGEITPKNIEELAKSCTLLNNLLKDNEINAMGLANVLTLIEQGTIGIDNLNDSLIKALSTGESFQAVLANVHDWIEGFNAGTDLTEGTEHIISQLEKASEYVSDWQFGNEPLENIYDQIFGKGEYDKYLRAAYEDNLSFEDIQAYLQGEIDKVSAWAEDEGLGALQFLASAEKNLGITTEDGKIFHWDLSEFESTEQAIKDVAGALGVSEDAARAFIEAWASHMWDLGEAWDNLNYKDQLKAFSKDIGEATFITRQDLEALGKATNRTAGQVLADLQELTGHEINIVNWVGESGEALDGKQLLRRLSESLPKEGLEIPANINLTLDDLALEKFIQRFITDSGSIDATGLMDALINEMHMTPEQAASAANQLASDLQKGFTKTIEVPIAYYDEESDKYVVDTKEIELEAPTIELLDASVAAAEAKAQAQMVATMLGEQEYTSFGNSLFEVMVAAGQAGASEINSELGSYTYEIEVGWHWKDGVPPSGGISSITGHITNLVRGAPKSQATGGIVQSAAIGSIKPGISLTGEEGPEIVWNKEQRYSYITGKNGPEFQNLQPGDRVFSAPETRRILRNSSFAKGGYYGSAARTSKGGWNDNSNKNSPAVVEREQSSAEWKNSLDWLYDLMEDIAEEEHKQTLIQSEYELATKDLTKTGRDLFNLTKSELETLNSQLEAQQFAFEKRLQQMNELQQKVVAEGFEEYLRWNAEDNSLEIDWDKINEITDKNTYDKLSELVSDMEKVQDQMDEAQEATLDIKKQIQELQTRYLQAYLDFQDKVMEAVVAQYQQNIDSLSELNDTINDANQSILDSIQKEIDLQRQIRDNTDTEKEIADIEARLAILQRDTTGANQQEILKLQKQLDEARENYSDTLIDQAIDRLSQNNSDAQEQREKQIELLEAQLEYWQETGALWEEVANLIAEGFTSQGSIIEGSTLWEFLKDKDSWEGLSQAQKDNWANELILESTQVGAYLIQLNDGTEVSTDRIIDSIIGEHGLAGEITAETRMVRAQLNELIATLGGTPIDSIPGEGGYASGGLATKTGLAMLHGTTNEPEYVLNARQTDAFLRLADVLPSLFSSSGRNTNNIGGNIYVELNMNVGEIGSDYDVDRLVERVKEDIYDASSYRNVNTVSFLR